LRCCGVCDLATLINPDSAEFKDVVCAVGWAYSGSREYRTDEPFVSSTTITHHISEAFPPTFTTVGTADPLLPQSRAMVAALESKGATVETLFYPDNREPALGHEYQFDLSLPDGCAALEQIITSFRAHKQV
jgi:acetyl esterase/lipase